MAANVEVLGLAEAGYALEDFATAEGNRVPVTTEEETPLYVAGTAALADESLGEVAEERIAESGEGGWKDVVGHAQMRSENDVGKEIYVKSINPGTWIGPLAVVMAFPPDRLLEKVQNKQVVALDKGVGKRIGLMKYGQTKDVEVSWGGPPDDGMGPAQEAGSPEMRLDTTGGTGARATSFSPGRRPSASDSFALRGASVGSAARMSGLSETAVSNELQGRVDMDVGARDVVGGAIERTKGERAAWVMAAQTASQPSITIPDFDWSGLPQVIGGYNYNWDDYYNQFGGGGYDDPYGGEVPPTILTADEQAAQSTGTFFTGQPYSGPAEEGSLEHYAWDRATGASVHDSYAHWVYERVMEFGASVPDMLYVQEALELWMNLYTYDENGEKVLDANGVPVLNAELSEDQVAAAQNYGLDEPAITNQEEAVQKLVEYRSDEDIAAWVDPFGHGDEATGEQISWETEKDKEVEGMPGITVGELFGGNWRKWQEERRMMEQMGGHDAYVDAVSQQGAAAAAAQAQAQEEARAAYQHWQEQQDKAEKARKRRAAPEYFETVEDIEEWAEENPHKVEEEQRQEEADAGFLAKPEYMEDMPKEEWMAHYGHRYGV